MLAAVTVDIADVFEILDPFIKAQKVKVGGRDEIDRIFVSVKEPANF
jgi:hypothetical protein